MAVLQITRVASMFGDVCATASRLTIRTAIARLSFRPAFFFLFVCFFRCKRPYVRRNDRAAAFATFAKFHAILKGLRHATPVESYGIAEWPKTITTLVRNRLSRKFSFKFFHRVIWGNMDRWGIWTTLMSNKTE